MCYNFLIKKERGVMILKKEDVIEFNDNKYMVLDVHTFKNKEYGFLNILDNNLEATKNNVVIEIKEDGITIVEGDILNDLVCMFTDRIVKTII